MARRSLVFVLLGFGLGPGCLTIRRDPQPPTERSGVYTEPTGDGSHYIEVQGKPNVPPGAVRGKWRRTASRVCEGDYLVMVEDASVRRRGPLVESRVHEGFVRCVSPDVDGKETTDDEKKRDRPVRPRMLPRLAG